MSFADPPGYQLRVLGAEVNHEDAIEVTGGRVSSRERGHQPIPTPWLRCSHLPSVCSAGATITSAF